MISVRINGIDSPVKSEGLSRMPELIELVKSWIDPEHMITNVRINGQDFEDADWVSNLSRYGTAILEVDTDTPARFVASRLNQASSVIRTCYFEFRDARKSFQDGNMNLGNQKLLKAVNTLHAFFDWFGTLMELVPAADKPKYDISPQVREITEVCKRICQQQLYQSWWALGEAIEKELEPKLDKLEDFCRKFRV